MKTFDLQTKRREDKSLNLRIGINSSFSSNVSLDDKELKLGSSDVRSVFLPLLQRCTDSKTKIEDDPVVVFDNSFDFGESYGIKSAKQKAVVSDQVEFRRVFWAFDPSLNTWQYVDKCYSIVSYCATWSSEFYPIPHEAYCPQPSFIKELLPNADLKREKRGRPRSTRLRNGMNIKEGKKTNRCVICREVGYNRANCPSKPRRMDA
ncbi:hypothetical protein QVD17_39221 [Tagetes erecta]|uniref:Uncharacterized protein n=1 Tax=Tagetes erecta TaxID=13708 RepID=A0AAD8JPU8_TARER|nr:hypothetical protein QVD17_39221 [Tagetes erecta]